MSSTATQKNKKKRAKKREQRVEEDSKHQKITEIDDPVEALKAKIEEAKLAKDHKRTQELRSELWRLQDSFVLGTSTQTVPDLPSTTAQTTNVGESSDVGANEKQLKSLHKKLKQIEVLKEKEARGDQLEANQIEKLSREKDIRDEIAEIEALQKQFSLI